MIKLKELLSVNEMTYNDGPTEKHQSKIDYPITLFEDFEISLMPYPDNSSKQTIDELKELSLIEGDEEFVKEHDDVDGIFQKKHKELGLEFNRDEAKDLLRQSSKYIMKEKYKYNRPRPYQLAEFYNIDLNGFDLDSMKTPSYPSGHAAQGYLLGMHYSKKYPEHRKKLTKIGEDIAHSRIVAKAHYPTDKIFGKTLAEYLFTLMK